MGEPFTHPSIYAMIEAVKRRGLHLTIITNLVAADADRVLSLGVDELLIGIHGATEAAYRAFHPSFTNDEWQRLLYALGEFRLADRHFKHVQVICRTNAGEVADMVAFAHRHEASRVNFKLASLKEGTEACRITVEQRQLLVKELVPRATELARGLGVPTNLDVFARQLEAGEEETARIADVGCFMGFVYARVTVDGTVLFCCNTDVRVGSLASGKRFSELWAGGEWQAMRDRMRRGEYLPSCGQCGKLNQNVAIGRKFAAAYGDTRRREVTGR
jgi:MoaA/NifB/PqqE/SkfB family radical SAM enzyme